MSIEDKMTIDERRKYLHKMQERYVKANRKEKGRLLDEMESVTGLQRKYLITLMGSDLRRKPRDRQRGRTYGPVVGDALRAIYESYDCICAERLTPNLVWMAENLAEHGELEATGELLEKLGRISISTVGRILDRIRQDEPRLRPKKPKRGKNLSSRIPMTRIPWDTRMPGHFEVDLVHHCGPTASGEYVCSLQMIDVATGWSERVAVLGRSYLVMQHAFRTTLLRLPFPILEIHPDNGSEFLNYHMLRFWGDIVTDVTLTRSRPFFKNDNRNVEQKNYTLVRAYLGYDRLDTVAQTLATNHLYNKMWLYYNLFQPVMHLREKIVVPGTDGQAARVKRHHDVARTPFDRLCDTRAILSEHEAQLRALRDRINPRQLRREIYDLAHYILSLPQATPGHSENVHLTLTRHSNLTIGGDEPFIFSFSFNRNETKNDISSDDWVP